MKKIHPAIRSIILFSIFVFSFLAKKADGQTYSAVVAKAERWIHSLKHSDSSGAWWQYKKESSVGYPDLYSGNLGIIIFYLELFNSTGNRQYLEIAEAGLKYAIEKPDTLWQGHFVRGLYAVDAGFVYALNEVYKQTKNKVYKEKAAKTLRDIADFILKKDEIPLMANDIMYGYAGIGLTYLYADQNNITPDAKQVAIKIGDILLEKSLTVPGGSRWRMEPRDTLTGLFMPNFSHGTSGIAYFLTCLYEVTKERRFLDAGLQAANYLKSIANKDGWVYHAEPDTAAMNRYYVSWCHGPAGTSRLYYKLYQVTGRKEWKNLFYSAAEALVTCGLPEKKVSGYWNNVSYCCGNAGIAEYMLSVYKISGKKKYMDFADVIINDMIRKGVEKEEMIWWPQAEVRKRPDQIESKTGLMQGAAGIGLVLLHADAVRKNKPFLIKLPDNPF